MELQKTFTALLQRYTTDARYTEMLWQELFKNYSGRKRYYHNLSHLEVMLEQLTFSKPHVQDWDPMLFSLFYHDAVYNPLRHDNEARSAALAFKRLRSILPPAQLQKCCRQILATQKHERSDEGDTNLFTDADLSILGQDWLLYITYCNNVRNEYAMYPDFIYNRGRKKVLEHFLQMEAIFKTVPFFDAYEKAARENMGKELAQLQSEKSMGF